MAFSPPMTLLPSYTLKWPADNQTPTRRNFTTVSRRWDFADLCDAYPDGSFEVLGSSMDRAFEKELGWERLRLISERGVENDGKEMSLLIMSWPFVVSVPRAFARILSNQDTFLTHLQIFYDECNRTNKIFDTRTCTCCDLLESSCARVVRCRLVTLQDVSKCVRRIQQQ